MADQRKYKATLFTSLWYAQFIGFCFAWWIRGHGEQAGAMESALIFTARLGSMW